MTWKTKYRSIYYEGAPEPKDFNLILKETALLVIDIQNTYLKRLDRESLELEEQQRYDAWTPFHNRMHKLVIPQIKQLLDF